MGMAQINISSWSLAQMFGLEFVSSDWLDEDSAEVIYKYSVNDLPIIERSNLCYMNEADMHDKVAEEFLRTIGSAAVIK